MPLNEQEQTRKDQAIASEKRQFVSAAVTLAGQLTDVLGLLDKLAIALSERGYAPGGDKEITENDLTDWGFSVEDFYSYLATLQAMGLQAKATEGGWVSPVGKVAPVKL